MTSQAGIPTTSSPRVVPETTEAQNVTDQVDREPDIATEKVTEGSKGDVTGNVKI